MSKTSVVMTVQVVIDVEGTTARLVSIKHFHMGDMPPEEGLSTSQAESLRNGVVARAFEILAEECRTPGQEADTLPPITPKASA